MKNVNFTKSELQQLNSNRAVEYLLLTEKPDFQNVLLQLQYEEELVKLQTRLIKLQNWMVNEDERILILFEGREFAGKGAAIRACIDHLNPRSARSVALQKPTDREQGQWYFKRYVEQLPEKGEIVFFDRSWYNRAIVEPVNGFCTQSEYKKFMGEVNHFEKMLVNDGIRLIKFYLSITKREQKNRIAQVQKNPLRRWELSPIDKNAVKLWDEYTKYKTRLFAKTNLKFNSWKIIPSDSQWEANIEILHHILHTIPFKD